MKIEINAIDNHRIEDVRKVTWQSWMHTYSRFIPERDLKVYFDEHYSFEALEKVFNDTDVRGFIAEVGGTAVGYARTTFNKSENNLSINSIYVLPDYQGRGIGTMLLDSCLEAARGYRVPEVCIGVMVENKSALAWYRKIGFNFVREEPFTMGGTTVSHLIGYKPI